MSVYCGRKGAFWMRRARVATPVCVTLCISHVFKNPKISLSEYTEIGV